MMMMIERKKSDPLVSIVIPVYNGSNYLREAIESALKQTYKKIEIIVINDGSKDDGATAKIAKSYGKKIRYYEKQNGGVATALNMGIKKMRGQYFSWLSHDDLYKKNKIASQISYIQKHPEYSNAILYSDYDLVNKDKKVLLHKKISGITPHNMYYKLISTYPINGCTLLIPRKAFSPKNLFDSRLRVTQDYDLWLRLAKNHSFIHIPRSLLLSRIHSEQDTLRLTETVLKENNQLYVNYIKGIEEVYAKSDNNELKTILFECAIGLATKNFYFPANVALNKLLKINNISLKEKIYYLLRVRPLILIAYSKTILFRAKKLLSRDNSVSSTRKTKKKILIISPAFYPMPGGLSEQTYLLAKSFVKKGYNVDVLTEQLNPSLPLRENIDKVSIYRIKNIKNRRGLGLVRLAYNMFVFAVKNYNYNFCIIRGISSHAIIIGILKSLKVFNIKTFITAETGDKKSEITELKKRRLSRLLFYFLKKHDFVNSNNRHHYRQYVQYGFAKNKLTIIYNGVDTSNYSSCKYPVRIDKFIFLSELNREKGVRELLHAFHMIYKKYPDKKLIIGGFGKESQYITTYIKNNKLDNAINFVGLVKREEKRDFFLSGDCFVFPSYSEGYGMVVAEAAVYKRHIISTDVADIKRIYGNQIMYCNKKDHVDLYKTMKRAIQSYKIESLNYDDIINKVDINLTTEKIEKLFLGGECV